MPRFSTPYKQYAEREGQECEILRELTDDERDSEVGTMYRIKFLSDGQEIDAWPSEIFE